jgi:hypothetical protein
MNRIQNIIKNILSTSLEVLISSLIDIQQGFDVLANVSLIEVSTSQKPELFRSCLKLSVDIVHDVTDVIKFVR